MAKGIRTTSTGADEMWQCWRTCRRTGVKLEGAVAAGNAAARRVSKEKQQSTGVDKCETTGTMGWTRPGNILNMSAAAKIAASPTRTIEQRGAGDGGNEEEFDKSKKEEKDAAVVEH